MLFSFVFFREIAFVEHFAIGLQKTQRNFVVEKRKKRCIWRMTYETKQKEKIWIKENS